MADNDKHAVMPGTMPSAGNSICSGSSSVFVRRDVTVNVEEITCRRCLFAIVLQSHAIMAVCLQKLNSDAAPAVLA